MGQMLNRRRGMGGAVEQGVYLQYVTTIAGSTYVNSKVVANGVTRVVFKANFKEDTTGYFFGSRNSLKSRAFGIIVTDGTGHYMRFDYGSTITNSDRIGSYIGSVHTFEMDRGVGKIDDVVKVNIAQQSFTGYDIILCGFKQGNGNPSAFGGEMDVVEVSIYQDDVLVKHYVPYMVGTVAGLLETVGNKFTLPDSGSFIAGPIITE
jgi:hypothetical protein